MRRAGSDAIGDVSQFLSEDPRTGEEKLELLRREEQRLRAIAQAEATILGSGEAARLADVLAAIRALERR